MRPARVALTLLCWMGSGGGVLACGTASIAQLAEHALRKRTVVGSIPTGGFFAESRATTTSGQATENRMGPGITEGLQSFFCLPLLGSAPRSLATSHQIPVL